LATLYISACMEQGLALGLQRYTITKSLARGRKLIARIFNCTYGGRLSRAHALKQSLGAYRGDAHNTHLRSHGSIAMYFICHLCCLHALVN